MSGVPAAPANRDRYLDVDIDTDRRGADVAWAEIASAAPRMAETMRRYLGQVATFLAPSSVVAAEAALRIFGRWLVATTSVVTIADTSRSHIEDFKVYLAGPAWCSWRAAGREHPAATAADAAGVLRADHRVGLG